MSAPGGTANGRRSVVIESLGLYLPQQAVSTSEVVAGCTVPLRIALERLTGIHSRRVAAPEEFSVDLARAAVDDCLARSRHRADAIDLLICASISRYDAAERFYSYEPSAAMRLKAERGFERALTFDVSNGCAGLWTGIWLALSMISIGSIERALIVCGEFVTDLTRTAQREIESYLDPQMASLTVGDSGAAVLLEASSGPDGAGFQALDLYTLGRYAGYCVSRPSQREHGGWVMRTDVLRLGARAIEHVVTHLSETLRKTGWSPRDIAHLVPHQTSEMTLVDALKRINERMEPDPFPAELYRINLAERANTATTTHFVAIRDAVDAGQIRSGDRAAFCITGSGLSIGTALYTFDDLPDRLRGGGAPREETKAADAGSAQQRRLEAPVASVSAVGLVRGAEAAKLDTVELCRRAGNECLARAGCEKEDVELLIHSGVYRTDFIPEPAMAALAAGALDLNAAASPDAVRKTFAFDLLSGHLGTLKACWVAEQMIRAGTCGNALVLASDVENNVACPEHGLYGVEAAGSALLIERGTRGAQFELFHFRDFPEYLDQLEAYVTNPDGRPRLIVRRQSSFAALAARCVAITVQELLASLSLSLERFDAILVPAGFPELNAHLMADLAISQEHLVSVSATGDLIGSSLAAGIRALEDRGRVKAGFRVLVLAAGAGLQAGCAFLRFA